jgi:hypothetical protein
MPPIARKPGRPSIRSPKIALAICEEIASGKSLYHVLEKPGMPSYAAVCVWLREDSEFREQYARAREAQADAVAEEVLKIADGSGDVQRDRLRIDARMWYLGKLHPKKYGTKPDAAATVNVAVGVNVITEEVRARFIEDKKRANAFLRTQRDERQAFVQ